MKPGSLVRIYSAGNALHGSIGLVTGIVEENNPNNYSWPHGHKTYYVLTSHGTHSKFYYENLIESTDGYFENDSYFYPPR
jgi:hypothetical protein